MTTDQLTPEQKAVSGFFPDDFDARGWGFCVGVVTRREHPAAPGRAVRLGRRARDRSGATTPSEQMVTILLTNVAWTSPRPPPVALDFLTGAYAAVDD